jgi:hypothetical protein
MSLYGITQVRPVLVVHPEQRVEGVQAVAPSPKITGGVYRTVTLLHRALEGAVRHAVFREVSSEP